MGISYLMEPTDDAYAIACKKRGVKPNSEILEDGTRAHWIGDSTAQKIIINFHGLHPYVTSDLPPLKLERKEY